LSLVSSTVLSSEYEDRWEDDDQEEDADQEEDDDQKEDSDDDKYEHNLSRDIPGDDELDRVQTFVTELESSLSGARRAPGEFMHEGRMYHLLDWERAASAHDNSEDQLESVQSSDIA
jgi:hypothetical protein